MTQTAEERRLRRIASSYNRDATRIGDRHRVTWDDLWLVETTGVSCVYCHIELDIGQGTFDHVIPLDRGGANALGNLVRCCYQCQHAKGTKTVDEFFAARDLRVACEICGTVFRPRWAEYQAGRGRLCSRRCAALKRWSA